MNASLKTALAGTIGGAVLGAALVFVAAGTGHFPSAVSGPAIRDYLMAHPELVSDMTNRLQDLQQAEQDRASAAAMKQIGLVPFFDPRIAFVTGPARAKTTLVEFYDYDCPYCRASIPAMKKYYEAHKNDTRFSFIEFPIPSLHGPGATLAARMSLAARNQPDKYIALHFALMSQESAVDEKSIYDVAQKVGLDMARLRADMAKPEIDEALAESHALADKVGINGTPTFIVNGAVHPGAVDDFERSRPTSKAEAPDGK